MRSLAERSTLLKNRQGQVKLVDLEGGGGHVAPAPGGRIFYVDSVSGSSVNGGEDTDHPMATIDQAISLAAVAATRGDVIAVLPGHAENIAAATSLVADIAGLRIVGFGVSRARPVLTWTATGGTIEMDAANCTLENLAFVSSISAVTVGINVDAAGCQIIGCEMNWDETGDDFARMIDCAGVARVSILGNTLIAEDTAGTNEGIFGNNSDDLRIEGNYLYGDFTEGAIDFETGASTNVKIIGNDIYNSDTTAGIVVDSAVSDTGIIADNRMTSLCTTKTVADNAVFNPGTLLDGGGNWLTRGIDQKAYRVPVAGNTSSMEWRLGRHASTVFDGGTVNAHGDDGGTGDPYTVFVVLGDVVLQGIWGIVNTDLTNATATIEVGVVGNTASLIAQETATELDDGGVYVSATQVVGAGVVAGSGAYTALNDGVDVIETVATADVTGGQIDYYCIWAPCEDGAYLA